MGHNDVKIIGDLVRNLIFRFTWLRLPLMNPFNFCTLAIDPKKYNGANVGNILTRQRGFLNNTSPSSSWAEQTGWAGHRRLNLHPVLVLSTGTGGNSILISIVRVWEEKILLC